VPDRLTRLLSGPLVHRMRMLRSGPLTLEPQMASHAEEMFGVLCDPAIYEYESAPPASVDALRVRYVKLESRRSGDGREQWLNWVIRMDGVGLIGYVQATVHANGSAGIAYEIASEHWGRGHARRATEAMIEELIGRYGVTMLFAVAKQRNYRSLRLLERLGFSRAGPELFAAGGVGPDEALMVRAAAMMR
jgi:RimJ/RimL family protein N-acetyltransferase